MARHWLQRPVSRGVRGRAQSGAGVPVTARSDGVPDVWRRVRARGAGVRARGAGVPSRQALGQVLTMLTSDSDSECRVSLEERGMGEPPAGRGAP